MAIEGFQGPYRDLSNFGAGHVRVFGHDYRTREHAYQAAKSADDAGRLLVARAATPGEAKRAGRKVPMRPEWERVKKQAMLTVELAAYNQNGFLAELLLSTEDETLVETNRWHDNFWGDCVCPRCSGVPGLNYLGRLLMAVRDVIRVD